MALGKQDLDAQYARALQLGKTPQGFAMLKQAALGQNDDFDQVVANMALKQLSKQKTAMQGAQAQQQLAQQGQQTVRDRILAEADQALPEMQGIGRLPAPNMEALAAAQGGVVGYADGGEVERYQMGGYIDPYQQYQEEMGLVPQRNFWTYSSDLEAQRKRQQQAQQAPAPAAAAPAATGINPVKAPAPVKKALANVSQPKEPVENPTKEEKSNLDKTLADTEKLYSFLDKKFGDQLAPIKEQLDRDREAYKSMKSENVGLALLGAAGSLLKPGRSTASAIGEGLGTLAEYGSKFQPQLLAARQGISAGEVGLAQAQAQAARGNFSTAAQLVGQEQTRGLTERELAAKEKLWADQGAYYRGRGAGVGDGSEMAQMRLFAQQLDKQIKDFGIPTSAADKSRLEELKALRDDLMKKLTPSGLGGAAPVKPLSESIAGTYQRP